MSIGTTPGGTGGLGNQYIPDDQPIQGANGPSAPAGLPLPNTQTDTISKADIDRVMVDYLMANNPWAPTLVAPQLAIEQTQNEIIIEALDRWGDNVKAIAEESERQSILDQQQTKREEQDRLQKQAINQGYLTPELAQNSHHAVSVGSNVGSISVDNVQSRAHDYIATAASISDKVIPSLTIGVTNDPQTTAAAVSVFFAGTGAALHLDVNLSTQIGINAIDDASNKSIRDVLGNVAVGLSPSQLDVGVLLVNLFVQAPADVEFLLRVKNATEKKEIPVDKDTAKNIAHTVIEDVQNPNIFNNLLEIFIAQIEKADPGNSISSRENLAAILKMEMLSRALVVLFKANFPDTPMTAQHFAQLLSGEITIPGATKETQTLVNMINENMLKLPDSIRVSALLLALDAVKQDVRKLIGGGNYGFLYGAG